MEEFFRNMRIFSKKSRMLRRGFPGIFKIERQRVFKNERDESLLRELMQIPNRSKPTCEISTSSHDALTSFILVVKPKTGYWNGGNFQFLITIPDSYPRLPPDVTCLTRIWHPNITEDGEVKASILELRSNPEEPWGGSGRTISDVVSCLQAMLLDIVPYTEPLNEEASEMLHSRRQLFRIKAALYVWMYAR